MGEPERAYDEEGTELLLVESGERERSWRLNFDGFRPSEPREKPPPRGLHDCLGVLGTGDVVAEYYQQQEEMLEGFNEMDALTDRGFLPGMSKEEREKIAKSETMAIRLSNIANMVLFAAKVYASVRSGSLAIIASTLDSLLDLLSGFILWFTACQMQSRNPYQYPIGKRRMQPLDHFFDVITNIIGLVAALLANYVEDWIDPVGAVILALYTIRTWSMTVLENVNSLVGRSAAPEYLQKLTYLCWNHHKAIRHIDTVRAYTFGSHYFVEVDIVLPSEMPLREAHDIGEALQEKLEQLPEIERAFVHLDYEFTHKPEHAQSHDD
ncbi:hypothetical protein C4D60_Mb09t02990 [Musa balbisiana]|uniref:Uncharacterized protein n=1 Tax=Musa balbisiana TaxID=52838 RepID=A0A4S8IG13_MUSBA|nr:hypothetical protein C4D60_Mb09t02990 [Musa balbisiana]